MLSKTDDNEVEEVAGEIDSAAPTKIKKGRTNKGIEIFIQKCPNGMFWEVKNQCGGQLPKKLAGKFTKFEYAENAVNGHYGLEEKNSH